MSDKERLENLKSLVADNQENVVLSYEDYQYLLEQAKHRQKLLERLNKRGIEVRKLKSQLSRCREKNKKSDWNLLVLKGTAEQSMKANKSNYELVKKLEEENKRLREALVFYASGNNYLVYYDKIVLTDDGEIARKALEGKMI